MSESERPGRYPRTTNGLVAALVVTVVAVVGVIGLMALFRDEPDIKPEEVDYLETVGLAQDADIEPVYPAELPEGWIATRAEVLPDAPPGFDLALLTDDEEFVGLVWSGEPIDDLLAERVDDEDVEDADPFTAQESVAPRWDGYADPGGDVAYAAEVGDHAVLVYGSAPEEDVRTVVESLTTAPLSR